MPNNSLIGLLAISAVCGWLLPERVLHAQRVVHETASEWHAANPLSLRIEQQWCTSVDDAGCDFKGPATARAMPDGGLLASDVRGPINRFGANGKFIRALGRRGQGPGEYGFVIDAHVASNGLVTWFDNTQMRIASVRLDGTPGPITRLMPPMTMANLTLVDTQLVVFDVPATEKIGDTVVAMYRTVPVSGSPKVLARVKTAALFTPTSEGMMLMRSPFQPYAIGHVGFSGVVAHTDGGSYDVQVFPQSSDAWRLRIGIPPRRATSSDRDSATKRVLEGFKVSSVNALPPSARAAVQNIGVSFPPVSEIRVLRDGTIWIRPTPVTGAPSARWDVFTVDGQRLGFVLLPHHGKVWDGERGWILVSQLGADDVPTFFRYRVGG